MKFVKQLRGFCVTYVHNPLDCPKCVQIRYSDHDNFEETFYEVFVAEEIMLEQWQPWDFGSKNVPLSNVPKTHRVSKDINITTPSSLPSTPLSSSRCTKKKNLNDMHSSSSGHSTTFQKINKTKFLSKHSKKICHSNKTCTERNEITVKKLTSKSVQKTSGDKIPGKGTLKRKRWFIEQLQQKNENYEDDLFEDQKFGHFRNLLEDDSDNEKNYTGLKTPIFPFSLSPRESTPSPEFTDCYSAEQLSLSRKLGEEYQYRLKKKRKLDFPAPKQEPETPRVVQETKPEAILDRLLQVEKILKTHISQEKSDTEEDPYFSDILK